MLKHIFCILLLLSSLVHSNVLRVGVYENAPKIFIDNKNLPSGFFPELLNEVAKENNLELKYFECSWEECLNMIENNQLDMMPDVAYSESRIQRFIFGNEIVLSSWSEIYRTKNSNINSIFDLTNKKVALLKSGIQHELIKETMWLFDVQPIFIPVNSYTQALQLLKDKQVDAALVNNFFGRFHAQDHDIARLDTLLSPSALKIAYSKKLSKDIIDIIEGTIKKYKANKSSIYYQLKIKWLDLKQAQIIPKWIIYTLIISLLVIIVLIGLVAFFQYLVKLKANEIEKQTLENQKLAQEQARDYKSILLALIKVIENRDSYTAGHSSRVAEYSKLLAIDLGIDKQSCDSLYEAGILHDIGKVAIPDIILLKPESLDTREYELIKEHVNVGISILEEVFRFQKLAEIIKYHHEKYDGSGYPYGLKGDDIPFLSHIMIVADAFDAMTTSRIYRHKKSIDDALKELERLQYIQFHPKVVKSAMKIFKNLKLENYDQSIAQTKLEEEKMLYFNKDNLTHLYNMKYLKSVLAKNKETKYYRYLYIFSLQNFAQYNYSQGWEAGDNLLINFANVLKENCDTKIICRLHADNFVILSQEEIELKKEFLSALTSKLELEITFTLQCFDLKKDNFESIETVFRNFKFKTNLIYDSSNN